jgi:hypothetical protein
MSIHDCLLVARFKDDRIRAHPVSICATLKQIARRAALKFVNRAALAAEYAGPCRDCGSASAAFQAVTRACPASASGGRDLADPFPSAAVPVRLTAAGGRSGSV